MTIIQFQINILQSNESEIISLISKNRKELKLLFINLKIEKNNTDLLKNIFLHIDGMNISEFSKNSDEIQFLFVELAFYFKQSSEYATVVGCCANIKNSISKNRLNAWIHYRKYNHLISHINLFGNYLQKLSKAVSDGIEDYENEVLRDLNDYYVYGVNLFKELDKEILIERFKNLFESEELQNEFPILKSYAENKFQFVDGVDISEITDKIFQPSEFTENLFNEKFLNYIRYHQRTNWHEIILGYNSNTIRSQIINFGQANFDNGFEELNASDVVKLYCYFNMRKHYYSSLSLFERLNPLKKLSKAIGIIKFIDIGCGPATSGIALTDYLNSITNTPVSFDYFGVDYYKSMRDEAKCFMDNDTYKPALYEVYLSNLKEFNFDWLLNASYIFINACYLFASDSLNETELAASIQNIKKSKPEVPLYFLFQNTTNNLKNEKYNNFKKQFSSIEVVLSENNTIKYNNSRNSFYKPVSETIFFEILKIN